MKRWFIKYILFSFITTACIIELIYYVLTSGFVEYCKSYSFTDYYKHWGPSEPLQVLLFNYKPVSVPIEDYVHNCNVCNSTDIDILILVKSDVARFDRRQAIRKSWGSEKQRKGKIIRTVFFIGRKHYKVDPEIDLEVSTYQDIVQGNLLEGYYNLTEKCLLTVSWAYKNCKNVSHLIFIDDDYYLSMKNMIKFIYNSELYPYKSPHELKTYLYAGYVIKDNIVIRSWYNKWYISIQDYPYYTYPPYIAGGVAVISQHSFRLLYIASLYTKYIKFQDVYLGMAAYKARLELTHNDEFYLERPAYIESRKHTIASHGFGNPKELARVWAEQRKNGFA